MNAVVTVRAQRCTTQVLAFPLEDGAPAANAEWDVIDTLHAGQSGTYHAHGKRIIMARTLIADATT
jgi:hypothetical protein